MRVLVTGPAGRHPGEQAGGPPGGGAGGGARGYPGGPAGGYPGGPRGGPDGGPVAGGRWWLQPVDDEGRVTGRAQVTDDLPGSVRQWEAQRPRWVWSSPSIYPALVRAGVRVARCHDLALTEALLRAHEGRPPATDLRAAAAAGAGGHPGAAAAWQASLFDAEPVVTESRRREGERGEGERGEAEGGETEGGETERGETERGETESGESEGGGGARGEWEGGESEGDERERGGGARGDRRPGGRAGSAAGGGPPVPGGDVGAWLIADHADQLARIRAARAVSPGFGLLVAAESAAGLAAVEMGHVGLPWRADVHDRVLTDLLGERPRHGGRPPVLQELAVDVARALDGLAPGGVPQLNVDSPQDLLRAFRRQGVLLRTTRAHELRAVDHPAVEPLLRYKELARLHVAHGWAWRDQWVRDGRFRPEYVPGGVVSGRWATRGGGALQIPRVMRAPVVADPGWALVVADAGQLEPRILAALSGDPGMVAATAGGDLYAALAEQALGRPDARDEMKIALLAAMYGARANTPAMAALRRRFPRALELLEDAARTGEDGGIVRSALGRTCPPPSAGWQDGTEEEVAGRARARGRFTRNFLVQASAADWANVLVAGLRGRLDALAPAGGQPDTDRPDLVLFQHDEVVVHTPQALVEQVVEAITAAGREATRLVLGERGVRVPLDAAPVASYADKR